MTAVEQFAAEAERFEQWAVSAKGSGGDAAREALLRLMHLYLAALYLPSNSGESGNSKNESQRVTEVEWGNVFASCQTLPFDFYGELFDPHLLPADEPGTGSLADDIADVYRDVVTGLRYYRAGRIPKAIWEWTFLLEVHWGEHATGAIRVLHCWLAANDASNLSAS